LIHSAFFDATDRTRYESDLLISRRELQAEVKKADGGVGKLKYSKRQTGRKMNYVD